MRTKGIIGKRERETERRGRDRNRNRKRSTWVEDTTQTERRTGRSLVPAVNAKGTGGSRMGNHSVSRATWFARFFALLFWWLPCRISVPAEKAAEPKSKFGTRAKMLRAPSEATTAFLCSAESKQAAILHRPVGYSLETLLAKSQAWKGTQVIETWQSGLGKLERRWQRL